jgi:hypothetical protein
MADDQNLREQLEECKEEHKDRVIVTWLIYDDRGSRSENENMKKWWKGMTPAEKVEWVFEEGKRGDWDDI